MENYFRNKGLFDLIRKWRYHLLIITVLAAGLGVLFSSTIFIQPKYKSKAVVYPVNTQPFSEESETEQLLEVIQSQDIRFNIFKAFNLLEHYEIDTAEPYYMTHLHQKFESNVRFEKTANEAVEISALDVEPQTASDMVDSLIKFYNDKQRSIQREKSQERFVIYKTELTKKDREMDSLEKVLNDYRKKHNMLDYEIQTQEYTRAIANGKSYSEAHSTLNSWRELGGNYVRTDSLLWNAMEDYHEIKVKMEQSKRDVVKYLTYTHVVTHPYPADRKAYPKPWIIVLFSALGAFLTGLLILTLIDRGKHDHE